MNNSSNQMPAALKPLPRLVLHADCTTCGKLNSEQEEPRTVVDIALDHTDATGHVVVLNGTTDFAGDEHEFAPPLPPPSIEEVLGDPAASSWLTNALLAALSRDPVDAANDAEVLARLLDRHCQAIFRAGKKRC